jgi:carbamoyltransferase
MIIVGIGGVLSDAACAVLKDGVLVSAAEEKKIARQHLGGTLPQQALTACLQLAKVTPAQVDAIALARPFAEGPESALHLQLRALFPSSRLVVMEHHAAHAASAYFASPFNDATVLTLDRQGDFRCGARWKGRGNDLQLEQELYVPDSLGDVFGRVAQLLGFSANADEHKVQWLSVSGDDRFVPVFEQMLVWGRDAWPRLDRSWFDADRVRLGGFSDRFYGALGIEDGQPLPEKLHAHIASGVQRAVERAVARMAGDAPRVCLAGGLGLNALLVAVLEREREVFVQPAAGNAGTAIGAALHAWHTVYGRTERVGLGDLCLGPEFAAEEIKKVLENCKLRVRYLLTTDEVVDLAAEQLNDNQIVAWMHGRMEFGPRALGNRSILASPLNPYSTENLNIFIKHREPFRKFAASVPVELASEYFDVGPNARYLATVGRVKSAHRATFESAILGDGLIRVHTVRRDDNPMYYRLLEQQGRKTGLPVLYNTSFNLFGDPLVCSPRDAARSFYSSGIDAMFVGRFFLQK